MPRYSIHPDAEAHPDAVFKVFSDGTKVATLTKEQLLDALKRQDGKGYVTVDQAIEAEQELDRIEWKSPPPSYNEERKKILTYYATNNTRKA